MRLWKRKCSCIAAVRSLVKTICTHPSWDLVFAKISSNYFHSMTQVFIKTRKKAIALLRDHRQNYCIFIFTARCGDFFLSKNNTNNITLIKRIMTLNISWFLTFNFYSMSAIYFSYSIYFFPTSQVEWWSCLLVSPKINLPKHMQKTLVEWENLNYNVELSMTSSYYENARLLQDYLSWSHRTQKR